MPRSSSTKFSRKRLALAGVVVLLLAVAAPQYLTANWLKPRLAESIGGAINRQVHLGDISLRLLPQPGFQISRFVVEEDPAFGAEPMLVVSEVDADLRLRSLLRGRIEISRLSFSAPSLNLVRAANGQWNLESVLARASQVPAAPTAAAAPADQRQRFPYIEAEDGRINFKDGAVKQVIALKEADFGLWLESDNQWSMRLEALPIRTDAVLGGTGTLRATATFVRAEALAETPISADLEWEGAQLGQVTWLVSGRDRGWRGDVRGRAKVRGTPRRLAVQLEAEVNAFRRYDIEVGGLSLSAGCSGNWVRSTTEFSHATAPALTGITCEFPTDDARLKVGGDVLLSPDPQYNISIDANRLSADLVTAVLVRSKRGMPADLRADGEFSGQLRFRRLLSAAPGPHSEQMAGELSAVRVLVLSQALGAEIATGPLRLGFARPPDKQKASLVVAPAAVQLNRSRPVKVQGNLSLEGYEFEVSGAPELKNLLVAGRMTGLERVPFSAAGSAVVDLKVAGRWAEFSPPLVTGSIQLRNVQAELHDVSEPIRLDSARVELTPQRFALRSVAARVENTGIAIAGSIAVPRGCRSQECAASFDLRVSQLDLDELNRLLNPSLRPTSWYARILPWRTSSGPSLRSSYAAGKLEVERLRLRQFEAKRVSAEVTYHAGRFTATGIEGRLLGGKHEGSWTADWTGSQPLYSGSGSIRGAQLAQLNLLMKPALGTGTIHASYDLRLSGTDFEELRAGLSGSIRYDWRSGSLRQLPDPRSNAAMRFSRWTGEARIGDGRLTFASGEMTGPGRYRTSGTAQFNGELDLRLAGDGDLIEVRGPLSEPNITRTPTVAFSPASNRGDAQATAQSKAN